MGAIDDLPPLRDVIRRHGISAKKSLGQNFLLDLNLTARIARAAGPLEGIVVVEIGSGPGGLTRALLSCGARRVIAIEKDERCGAALEEIAERQRERLAIWKQDALTIDYASAFADRAQGPFRIVANLPYNIGAALLTRWIENPSWPPWYDRLTLMFQREVAERIVATTQTREAYGRLAVLCGWRMESKILFDVSPTAFTPPPKVMSSVVELIPRAAPLACEPAALSRVTQAAFGQRRKMLRQSLKALAASANLPLAHWLESANINPTQRAEEIDCAGFVRLARALAHQPA